MQVGQCHPPWTFTQGIIILLRSKQYHHICFVVRLTIAATIVDLKSRSLPSTSVHDPPRIELIVSRYKCRICNKFKLANLFSGKELNRFCDRVTSGQKLNEISAKLRCRNCAGEGVAELECQGHCGVTKSINEFSRTQRSNHSLNIVSQILQ
jgi:hypothetical protein